MAQIPDINEKGGFFAWSLARPRLGTTLPHSTPPPLPKPTAVVDTSTGTTGTMAPHAPVREAAQPRSGETIAVPAAPELTAVHQKRPGLGIGERKLTQGVCDWSVVTGGAFTIFALSQRNYDPAAMAASLVVVGALWFFFADAFDAYKMPVMQSTFRSAYTAAKVLVMTVVGYTLAAWFAGGFLPVIRPRISETLEAILLIAPLVAARTGVSMLLTRAPLRRRVVVVGANLDGFEMGDALSRYDGKSYDFLGYFEDEVRSPHIVDGHTLEHEARSHGPHSSVRHHDGITQLVWPTSELVPIHNSIGIDQVVLANPNQTVGLLSTLSVLHERGVQITPMFAIYQDLTGRVPVSHLGDDWYVALPAHVKKSNRTYMLIKRVIDLAMAAGVLLFTFWLIPLLVLAIKLDSPGPVLFRQVRVGRGGKPFKIVKFRTMRRDAEALTGAVWATDRDPRITRIGRFLRKSRLDEIPQLWNVFRGDMSFVGPRPERPEFDEQLEAEIPFYRARRAVRPGLTGWAQVNHGYGNTMLDALRKVEYDLYYIKNESLYLDLLILLRTVAVVLKLGGK